MQNFKRHHKRAQSRAVDGFVAPSRQAANSGSIGFNRTQSYRPEANNRLDRFPKQDGFIPAAQGTVATSGVSTITSDEVASPPLAIPGKRHKRRKRKEKGEGRSWKKILKRSALALLALFILTGAFLGWKVLRNTSRVFKGGIFGLLDSSTKLKGEDKGRVNILLAGNSTDDPGHSGADLTDSIMLLSIDTVNHRGFMMSIPRDLWVNYGVRNCSVGLQGKINAAYVCGEQIKFHEDGLPDGGMGLLTKIVEQDFGVDIQYYTRINYTALKQAVDAVGGIDIVIKSTDPRGLYDSNIEKHDGGPLKLSNGPHHLTGQQALNLARARGDGAQTYGFASSDFTRTEHQRQMLLALKDKALSVGVLSNPAKVSSLLDAAGDNVQTNFKTNEVRRLYDISKQVSNQNIQSIGLTDKNVSLVQTFTAVNGTSAVRPVAGVSDFSDIKSYMRRLTSNDPVAREGATAVVLNGSGISGLARSKADELESKGVIIKSVATATVQANTTILAPSTTTKSATKTYLLQKFGVAGTTNPEPNSVFQNYDVDFVIILGQNEQTSGQN